MVPCKIIECSHLAQVEIPTNKDFRNIWIVHNHLKREPKNVKIVEYDLNEDNTIELIK